MSEGTEDEVDDVGVFEEHQDLWSRVERHKLRDSCFLGLEFLIHGSLLFLFVLLTLTAK